MSQLVRGCNKSAVILALVMGLVSDNVRGGDPVPLDGIPVAARASTATLYTFVRQCEARRQFEGFVKRSPLNAPEALQADARTRYFDRVAMLDERREPCAQWETSVPLDTASSQLYLSASDVALAGDRTAAACFLVKAWRMPSGGSSQYERIAKAYRLHSSALIEDGLANGSWPVVRATASALSSNHAVASWLTPDSTLGYRVSRLMQLGSKDAAMARTYEQDAAVHAARIDDPAQLQNLDQQTRRLFQSAFQGAWADTTSFTVLCD